MHTRFYILPLALTVALSACNSTDRYRSYEERPVVSDKELLLVPADDRDDIHAARAKHSEAVDAVTLAEQGVEGAKKRLAIAREELKISEAEVEAARDRVELARSSVDANRDDRVEDARKGWSDASDRRHRAWCQVLVEEGRIEEAECKVDLARRRVALAEARIELAKAEALNDVEREGLERPDLAQFERRVADEALRVKLAEVDVEACGKKLDLRQDALEDGASPRPSSATKRPDEARG